MELNLNVRSIWYLRAGVHSTLLLWRNDSDLPKNKSYRDLGRDFKTFRTCKGNLR